MPKNYKRLLKNNNSLTLVTGTRNLVSSLLMLEMMHEHLDGRENIRTIYIDAQSSYFEAKAKILRVIKYADTICIFENIAIKNFSKLLLILMNSEVTIWAGIDAPNASIGKSIFKYLLNTASESGEWTKEDTWIISTYSKLISAESTWNVVDLCELNKTLQQIESTKLSTKCESRYSRDVNFEEHVA